MSDFALDPRLLSDGVVIAEMDISFVLLMNNSLVPWFVLVPPHRWNWADRLIYGWPA